MQAPLLLKALSWRSVTRISNCQLQKYSNSQQNHNPKGSKNQKECKACFTVQSQEFLHSIPLNERTNAGKSWLWKLQETCIHQEPNLLLLQGPSSHPTACHTFIPTGLSSLFKITSTEISRAVKDTFLSEEQQKRKAILWSVEISGGGPFHDNCHHCYKERTAWCRINLFPEPNTVPWQVDHNSPRSGACIFSHALLPTKRSYNGESEIF